MPEKAPGTQSIRRSILRLTSAFAVVAVAVACLAQQQQPLTRQGSSWSQVTTGNFPCAIRGQLKVSAKGNVAVRGVSRDDCGFKVTQRTRASSEAEARDRMRGFYVKSRAIVETSTLTIQPGEGSAAFLDVEVYVPRTMREAAVVTRSGGLQAFDIEGSINLETAGGPIEVDRIGGAAVLRTAMGQVKVGSVAGTLNCYSGGGFIRVNHAGGETWCDTAGGEISIGEVLGPLHVTTAGGNIDVDRAATNVSARSMSGIIDIQEAGGVVTALAKGGSIQIGSSRGAKCEANGGTIRVKTLDGPLRLSTAMGNILAQLLLSSRQIEDSFVNSDAGDVTVLIPATFSLSVKAMNETPGNRGLIVSDFPEIRVYQSSRMQPLKAEGSLNGGGPLLMVSTGSGNIFLKRQK